METNQPKVVVIGSINMDMVTRATRFPKKGETISGVSFDQLPGGKGANQAVACARLGAAVSMVGAVGNDPTGKVLLKQLQDEKINTDWIQVIENETTGMAQITVAEEDNQIIIVPGANFAITKSQIDEAKAVIQAADLIILQLEIPLEIVEYTAEVAAGFGVKVILNPAPAQPLSDALLSNVHYLTPNETELMYLTKQTSVKEGMDSLLKEGVQGVIVTLGSKGVQYIEKEDAISRAVKGRLVEVVDTTGAGDTFNGALAHKLAGGANVADAIEFANAAAGLSIMRFGAQTGMPTFAEVQEVMNT
ncbi:ribokinase [Alkalicoccobacillus gibsonii]|uniref:ribokinase n=1 Tax=Alkalicoccobacillus gibsonii TaxID=79881 RepID=UPI003F7B97BF